MKTATNKTHLPADLSTDILVRLPLRSISRLKSVCKTWKSTLESVFFRRLFLSFHKNSSSSWSLTNGPCMGEEFIGLYRCETWDLPKPLVSYVPVFPDLADSFLCYATSNGLVLMEGIGYGCYVGNPVLQQWVEILSCTCNKCNRIDFVTRLDEDGVVLSCKVLKTSNHYDMCIYSSETGIWTSKRFGDWPNYPVYSAPMSLNGMHYFLSASYVESATPEYVIAHDFYSESDQCRAIPLPVFTSQEFKGPLTTSRGYLMYIQTLARKNKNVLKVWRLNNVGLEDECWQLMWKTPLSFVQSGDIHYHAPMAMHPFDSDIVYIWNQQNRCLVSFNVRTQNYTTVRDASERYYNDGCFMNQTICQKHMDYCMYHDLPSYNDCICDTTVALSQFALPRWMESVPCPPHVEMIDTTSLLSYIALVEKTKRGKESQGKTVLGS